MLTVAAAFGNYQLDAGDTAHDHGQYGDSSAQLEHDSTAVGLHDINVEVMSTTSSRRLDPVPR